MQTVPHQTQYQNCSQYLAKIPCIERCCGGCFILVRLLDFLKFLVILGTFLRFKVLHTLEIFILLLRMILQSVGHLQSVRVEIRL